MGKSCLFAFGFAHLVVATGGVAEPRSFISMCLEKFSVPVTFGLWQKSIKWKDARHWLHLSLEFGYSRQLRWAQRLFHNFQGQRHENGSDCRDVFKMTSTNILSKKILWLINCSTFWGGTGKSTKFKFRNCHSCRRVKSIGVSMCESFSK